MGIFFSRLKPHSFLTCCVSLFVIWKLKLLFKFSIVISISVYRFVCRLLFSKQKVAYDVSLRQQFGIIYLRTMFELFSLKEVDSFLRAISKITAPLSPFYCSDFSSKVGSNANSHLISSFKAVRLSLSNKYELSQDEVDIL